MSLDDYVPRREYVVKYSRYRNQSDIFDTTQIVYETLTEALELKESLESDKNVFDFNMFSRLEGEYEH
tara:strand:- start:384 stop:587 length:204 start_codon:yes stop_codon:yes gene_type:complete